jgi:propanol-preferring alcohol dehydrogenase
MDVVVDAVGHPQTLEAANRLVRPGGRIVCVGYSPTSNLSLPTPRVVLDELEIVGSRFAHRGDLERAIALVASGDVKPIVGLVASLEDVNDVFSSLVSGDVVGRAVLDVAGVRG